MNKSTDYTRKVMEDLDALLADLQSTTQHISYNNQGPVRANSSSRQKSETPPPLPPPPQDIPDTIPPPQQFGDQPLYETQNVRRDYQQKRISNSSQSSQGSVESSNRPYQRGPSPAQQYQSRTPPPNQGYQQGYQPVSNPVYHQGPVQGQGYKPGPSPAGQGMSVISNNLSELDQLLSDLNSAQFLAEVDKKTLSSGKPAPPVAPKPSRGGANTSTVDSLLDQLENSVPQTANTRGQYQSHSNEVNSYQYDSRGQDHTQSYSYGQRQQHVQPYNYSEPQQAVHTSSAATQELDDLMSSLSDFKMKDKPPSQQATVNPMRRSPSPGSEPSYAKPQKSRNLSGSSSANSSLQMKEMATSQHATVSLAPSTQFAVNPPGVECVYAKPEKDVNISQSSSTTSSQRLSANLVPGPAFLVDPVHGSEALYTEVQKSSSVNQSSSSKSNIQVNVSLIASQDSPQESEALYARPEKGPNVQQTDTSSSSLQSSSLTGNVSSQSGQLESMLGDLQQDLNKQGVSTKTKGLCAACNQPVVGQVITALGKIWHIEHFACAHCHETLGTKNFYERDGVAYCERDYHSLFAPRCGYCNGPIVDKCVTALNCTWHPEHFFCAQCGRPFGDEGFHERDGKAYCRADFFEMFAPKCGGCGRAIVDNYISALDRHWHPECFACWDCHRPFGGGSFFDYEGLPYCETHYHQKRGSLCAGCQKPIAGRCITAMYKKFHPEHFVCAFCLKQLNKGTFKEQNDRPYCHPCFVKLFG